VTAHVSQRARVEPVLAGEAREMRAQLRALPEPAADA
jgi:hypothetical protein